MSQEGLQELLRCPFGGWMAGDFKVHGPAAVMGKDHEYKQQPKCGGRSDEEIDGDDISDVVRQERTPRL